MPLSFKSKKWYSWEKEAENKCYCCLLYFPPAFLIIQPYIISCGSVFKIKRKESLDERLVYIVVFCVVIFYTLMHFRCILHVFGIATLHVLLPDGWWESLQGTGRRKWSTFMFYYSRYSSVESTILDLCETMQSYLLCAVCSQSPSI